MAGTIVADTIQADSTSTLVLKNGVANTPPTIQDSAGTQIGTFCRAWVNFNGTGTVAIRSSFNVTSITDNGTGSYTVNFTTAMADANFSCTANAINDGVASAIAIPNVSAAGSVAISTVMTTAITTAADVNKIYVAVFR